MLFSGTALTAHQVKIIALALSAVSGVRLYNIRGLRRVGFTTELTSCPFFSTVFRSILSVPLTASPMSGPTEGGRGASSPIPASSAGLTGREAVVSAGARLLASRRAEVHTSELQSHMRNWYVVFCMQ